MKKVFVGAVSLGIALFLTATPSFALGEKGGEAYSEIISKARHLILQKDRLKATRILQQAIRSKNFSEPHIAQLTKALEDLSFLFLTDEGQKEFQLGESLYYSGQRGALVHYEKAHGLEPRNIQVVQALARVFLREDQCTKSLQIAQKGFEINPYDKVLSYFQIRALYCLDRAEQAKNLTLQWKKSLSSFKLQLTALQVERLFKEGSREKAFQVAQKLVVMDRKYPRGHYWLWRTRPVDEGLEEEDAQRYLSLCKSLDSKMRRKYKYEPRVCGFIAEVDDFIKNRASN